MNYLLTNALVAMLFITLALTMFYRWTLMGHSHVRKLMAMGKESDQRYWMYNHHTTWARIKKSVLYAPLGSVRHNYSHGALRVAQQPLAMDDWSQLRCSLPRMSSYGKDGVHLPTVQEIPTAPIGDFGEFLNATFAESSYFHGLTGVNQ